MGSTVCRTPDTDPPSPRGRSSPARTEELPRPDATSLLLAGAGSVDRDLLLAGVLDGFGAWLDDWRGAAGDVDAAGIRSRYLAASVTIGQAVRLEMPGGRAVSGTAVDVDADGAIVISGPGESTGGRRTRYSAGDVVHLRPNSIG